MGAIRLFLAVAVFQSHIRPQILVPANLDLSYWFLFGMNGGYAVMFFFVVSGFLISFVLEQKYDHVGGTAAFYRARALRIYPLWWCLFLLVPFITEDGLWTFVSQRPFYDVVSGFFLYGSDLLLSFRTYPQLYTEIMPKGLQLGWALASEMSFYLLAPLILRSKTLPIIVLATSFTLRTFLNVLHPNTVDSDLWAVWCYFFLPSTAFFFMLGHLTRQMHKRVPLPQWVAWTALALAAAILTVPEVRGYAKFDNAYFYLAIGLFAAALPAIFDATKDNKFCNFLGDLTYPLYIASGVFLLALQIPGSVFDDLRHAILAFASSVSSGFATLEALVISLILWCLVMPYAAAVHFLLEKPASAVVRAALTLFERPGAAAIPTPVK